MQKKSIYSLSKLAVPLKSKGRFFKENRTNLRTDFQRDRDRIIHSTAFRRLKHKTQVFVNTSRDHFRTRITHSLEVSQIARTLSKFFNLNEDLCETLSLAHDLGHTPFGHAGEEELNKCMKKFGGFDHNFQTIKIVTSLENRYYDFNGLNLTYETLDGLLKHNGPIKNADPYKNILGKSFFNKKLDLTSWPSLEAQISSISDDIAYNNHDLEDGLRAKLFTIEDLSSISYISELIEKHRKHLKSFRKEIIINQIVRDLINLMVTDVIKTTKKNLKKIGPKSINDIYKNNKEIVHFSQKIKEFDNQVKDFLSKKMYNNKKVLVNTNKGKLITRDLFKYLLNNVKKYISNELLKNEKKERLIADFIAGMTDRYAINLYNEIK